MAAEDFYIEVAPDVDVTNMGLSMEEGFIFSRATGQRQTVSQLCAVSHFSNEKTRTIITALVKKGVLKMGGAGRHASGNTHDEYADVTFSPAALAEEVDLTLEQKKRILFVEQKLDEWNHYALLGLKRSAKGADIKKGYFRASKEFHPDSFFRRDLGSYQKRVDSIFRKMKAAYDTLNNDNKREEYDGTLTADDFTPAERRELEELAEKAAEEAAAVRKEEDRKKRLDDRLKSRRINRNPMLGRIKRGREFLAMAEKAVGEKKFDDAARHARMAIEYSKGDTKLVARCEDIIAESDLARARAIARKGEAFAATRPEEETERLTEELIRLAHGDGELLVVASKMYATMGAQQRAMKTAQAAANAARSESAWENLLELAEKTESWHAAIRAAEALLAMRPKDGAIKDRLKVAKRNA